MNDQVPATFRPQLTGGGAVVALVPQTLDEAYRLADALSRSGLTPYNIKTPEAVMACLLAGAELGFPPFQSLQSFAVINGRPSVYGAAVPALLWSRGFDIDEIFEGENPSYPDTMKAVCTVTRPNGKKITREFSVADAKTAKLWSKKNRDGSDTPWITNPKRMLQMRARGFAAQDGASDIMRGLPLYEEVQDYTPIQTVEENTGTGMAARLEARAVDVDAPGFNVRHVTENTQPTIDEVLAGDQIPAFDAPPKRPRGRPRKEAAPIDLTSPGGDSPQPDIEVRGEPMRVMEELTRPQEMDGVQSAEPEPDSPDSATDASTDSAAETLGQPDFSPPQDDGLEPESRPEVLAYLNHPFAGYADVKSALVHFRRTAIYADASNAERVAWQRMSLNRLDELRERNVPVPAMTSDPWQFMLYAGQPDAENLEQLFNALCESPAYDSMSEGQQDAIRKAAGVP